MSLRVIVLLFLLAWGINGFAQTYEELSKELEAAVGKPDIHRLKARLARVCVERLETGNLSETAAKKLKAEAFSLCSDVQPGAMDLWFGDSVVTWSRLLLLDGDWRGARAVLLDQAEVLQNIECNLAAGKLPVSAISPVAGCRYFLGETYRIEYEKTGELEPAIAALKHDYNVYIKYGDSPWGAAAQGRAEVARAFVEGRGKQVRIDLGNHRAAFVANQFRSGARLMGQEKYAEATEPILAVLNQCPETEKSIAALRNLGICWGRLDHREEAVMTAEYLCERFAADTNSPAAVLAIGRSFLGRNESAVDQIFGGYLATFPDDPHRADILSHFAWKAYKAEDWPEAAARFQTLETALRADGKWGEPLEKAVYIQAVCSKAPADYDRFVSEFPQSELAPRALGEKAQALLVADHFEAAFQTLETLAERYPDASDGQLQSVYRSAGAALLAAGKFAIAERAFSAMDPATDRSLYGLAAAQFGQKQFVESFQTLEKLLAEFPTTGRFYDVRLMQARALVQVSRVPEAIGCYDEVLAARPDHAVAFERAQILPDSEARLAAYQRIALLADPSETANLPLIAESILASLPLCIELKRWQLALDSCDQFEALFPNHDQLPTLGTFRKEAADALVL